MDDDSTGSMIQHVWRCLAATQSSSFPAAGKPVLSSDPSAAEPSSSQAAAAQSPSSQVAAEKVIVDAADGSGLSLAEMAAWAACVAREWRRGGLRPGDTVTLFLPNMAEYYVPVLAAWLCGAAVSCTDPDSRATTLARHVRLAGSKIVVAFPHNVATAIQSRRLGVESCSFYLYCLGESSTSVDNLREFYTITPACCGINHERVRAAMASREEVIHESRHADSEDEDEWEELSLPGPCCQDFDQPHVCQLQPLVDEEDARGGSDDINSELQEDDLVALDALARRAEAGLCIEPRWKMGPKDVCVIFWSSGTTGAPKGIPKTNQQLLAEMRKLAKENLPSPTLITCAFFHIAGFLEGLCSIMQPGGQLVFMDSAADEFNIEVAADLYRPATLLTKSYHLASILTSNVDPCSFSSIKEVVVIGSSVASVLHPLIKKIFPRAHVLNVYGLTEIGAVSTSRSLATIGAPITDDIQMRIQDPETGEELEPGQQGEIVVRASLATCHYLGDHKPLKQVDGWIHTGDLGFLDAKGEIHFVNRLKSLIIYNNRHIEPSEIENLLLQEPGVQEAAVFGVPHPIHHEVVTAVVVPAQRAKLDTKELAEVVNSKLDHHKWVRGGIHVVHEIPRNASGKVLRSPLRRRYSTGDCLTRSDSLSRRAHSTVSSAVAQSAGRRRSMPAHGV